MMAAWGGSSTVYLHLAHRLHECENASPRRIRRVHAGTACFGIASASVFPWAQFAAIPKTYLTDTLFRGLVLTPWMPWMASHTGWTIRPSYKEYQCRPCCCLPSCQVRCRCIISTTRAQSKVAVVLDTGSVAAEVKHLTGYAALDPRKVRVVSLCQSMTSFTTPHHQGLYRRSSACKIQVTRTLARRETKLQAK